MILSAAIWLCWSVPTYSATRGIVLALAVWYRCRYSYHWVSYAVIDWMWCLFLGTQQFRKSVSMERRYDTSFLICNCGEFHGMFDRQGMIELVMAVVCFELVVNGMPFSILRGIELALFVATWVQLLIANAVICSLLFGTTDTTLCAMIGVAATFALILISGAPSQQQVDEEGRTDKDTEDKLDALADVLNRRKQGKVE